MKRFSTFTYNAAFNAAHLAAFVPDAGKVDVNEAIALAGIAMADAESRKGMIWDGDFDTACEHVAKLIAEPTFARRWKAPFSRKVFATTSRHMIRWPQ